MQLIDAFCYVLLMITMTATCIQAESRRHELGERRVDKRLIRRDATVLIDSVPMEKLYNNPTLIYRRQSQSRYHSGPPKPKYGHTRTKYGHSKFHRRPTNKHRGKVGSHKYSSIHKKHPQKSRYQNRKRPPPTKPVYGPPKKKPIKFFPHAYKLEPMGFGEPPSSADDYRPPHYNGFQKPGSAVQNPDFESFHDFNDFQKLISNDLNIPMSEYHSPIFNDFEHFDAIQKQNQNPQKQGHGEPPVDSYGAPIKPSLHDLTYPLDQNYPDTLSNLDQDTYNSFKSWKSYKQDQNIDNKFAFSKKQPEFTKPNQDVSIIPVPEDIDEEFDLNSYSDLFSYRQKKDKDKKKNLTKILNPWKNTHKLTDNNDEIIVGGQYAEPPARYVSMFQGSAPMFTDSDDFTPLNAKDPELVASATNSPYVNYKNSNMAFSPQNLNDAFSIVDK